MVTANAINNNSTGLSNYNGTGTFTGDTVTQHAVLIGGAANAITSLTLTNGQLAIGNSGNDPSAANLAAGSGITIANGAGTITISQSPGSLSAWTDESTDFSAAVGNGYFITGTANATLPASPSQGQVVAFIVSTGGALTITGNTGQIVSLGSASSAAAGTCVNTAVGDSILLIYRSASTTWRALSAVGNWTLT